MKTIEKVIAISLMLFILYMISLVGTLMYVDGICLQQEYVKPHVSATYTGYCSKLIDGTNVVISIKDLK